MEERKLTVIEQYEKKGFLDKIKGKWSASDRCRVGLRLSEDFYKARLETVTAIDYSKERIDNSIRNEPDYILDARDRYNRAINAIPKDFFDVVHYVCCENKSIKGNGLTGRQSEMDWHRKMCDLCRGLDYLIKFYLGIGKKSL